MRFFRMFLRLCVCLLMDHSFTHLTEQLTVFSCVQYRMCAFHKTHLFPRSIHSGPALLLSETGRVNQRDLSVTKLRHMICRLGCKKISNDASRSRLITSESTFSLSLVPLRNMLNHSRISMECLCLFPAYTQV